jgi:hypothetical protein
VNGPEHYREAERLAEYAASPAAHHAEDSAEAAQIAQVHATLALVAATANLDHGEGSFRLADEPTPWDGKHMGDGPTWQSVTT